MAPRDPQSPSPRKPYHKPRLKYEREIHAVAGLCNAEAGTFFKNSGDLDNGFGNPCSDVNT